MIFLLAATILVASTIVSLEIIIIGIQIGIIVKYPKEIRTPFIKILSAIGSHNLPKSLIQLFFLARYPSNQSVMEAITKKIAPNKNNMLISKTVFDISKW